MKEIEGLNPFENRAGFNPHLLRGWSLLFVAFLEYKHE